MTERGQRRWWVVALGLGLIAVALVAGAGPFERGREFNRCDSAVDCFATEPVTVVGRRTYVKVSSDGDGESRTRVYEVTWERADGGRTTREVWRQTYDAATDGTRAGLRTWRGEAVRLELPGVTQRFTPRIGWSFAGWFALGWLGLGTVLWGLLVRWWDGWFMFGFRAFAWMFTGLMPATLTMGVVLYGWDTGGEVRPVLIAAAVAVVVTAVPVAMLWSTFRDR